MSGAGGLGSPGAPYMSVGLWEVFKTEEKNKKIHILKSETRRV